MTYAVTDRLYAEDLALDPPNTHYRLRLRGKTDRVDYHLNPTPLLRVDADRAAALASRRGRPVVWELLSQAGHPRGFVALPEALRIPVVGSDAHLLHRFLDWQLSPDRTESEYGLARYGEVVLSIRELREGDDFDGYNAAFSVPVGEKAPSGYQLRPYGQPDAPCRMAWAPAHALIQDHRRVLWFPDVDVTEMVD